MQFNLTYWQAAKYSAVIDDSVVTEALEDYIQGLCVGGDPEGSDLERAERADLALTAVKAGEEPADLDIIASALESYGISNTEGDDTNPDEYGACTGYVVKVRAS